MMGRQRALTLLGPVLVSLVLAACTAPQPYRVPPPSTPQPPPSQGERGVETQPAPPPETVEEPQPLPEPPREPTLSPASRALVGQAQTQLATKNYAVAASSIERGATTPIGMIW